MRRRQFYWWSVYLGLGHGFTLRGFEKIEITALIGLAHILREERAVAASVMLQRRHPGRMAGGKLSLIDT